MLFWSIYALFLCSLLFALYRGVIWQMFSVAPLDFSNQVDSYRAYYHELILNDVLDPADDGAIRVLLLGGSTAEQVAPMLERELIRRVATPVRLDNAALSAHTTRDSLNKLEYLHARGIRYDLIVLYHGINDVRMNCVPPEDFRDDYTHCHWYRSFERHRSGAPISTADIFERAKESVIDLSRVRADQLDWGDEIKTEEAFEGNLRAILGFADDSRSPVVLMTFATFLPEDYSQEAYEAGTLGYGLADWGMPVEVWGKPENVRRTVAVHNGVIRRLADGRTADIFVDQEAALREGRLFVDVCHLTPQGIEQFVHNVMTELEAAGWSQPAPGR